MSRSFPNVDSRLNDVNGDYLVFEIWRPPGGPLFTI